MPRSRLFLFALVTLLAAPLASLSVAAAVDVPLIDAVTVGDVARVRTLLDQGADVHGAEPDGTTPLHWAAYAGQLEILSLIHI